MDGSAIPYRGMKWDTMKKVTEGNGRIRKKAECGQLPDFRFSAFLIYCEQAWRRPVSFANAHRR
jgi:hypothetical protein